MDQASDRLLQLLASTQQTILMTLGEVRGAVNSLRDEYVGHMTRLEERVREVEVAVAHQPSIAEAPKAFWAQLVLTIAKTVRFGQALVVVAVLILGLFGILTPAEIKAIALGWFKP